MSIFIPWIWVSWECVIYERLLEKLACSLPYLQVHLASQTPQAYSLHFREATAETSTAPLSNDMGTRFHPYFTFSQYSSAHRKVSSAGLISLPFEQIICQSVLGTGMLLVLRSTFSAVKSGIHIK